MNRLQNLQVLLLACGFLMTGGGTAIAQTEIFDDDFEDGTCLQWSNSVPFCETPNVGLRIELTWTTSGDSDPFDNHGTDVDLHVLHPDAEGDWESSLDCYLQNPTPDWGVAGISQNPILIRSAQNGAGPEIIQITDPESGEYDIGVHYVDDKGYGSSTMTVQIYLNGTITTVSPGKTMNDGYFWEFGSIQWPSGAFTTVDQLFVGIP